MSNCLCFFLVLSSLLLSLPSSSYTIFLLSTPSLLILSSPLPCYRPLYLPSVLSSLIPSSIFFSPFSSCASLFHSFSIQRPLRPLLSLFPHTSLHLSLSLPPPNGMDLDKSSSSFCSKIWPLRVVSLGLGSLMQLSAPESSLEPSVSHPKSPLSVNTIECICLELVTLL